MSRVTAIIVIILLLGIIALQILSLAGLLPKTKVVQVCPVNAISMSGGKAVVDATKCIGCRRCVAGIPLPQRNTAAVLSAEQELAPAETSVLQPAEVSDQRKEPQPPAQAKESKAVIVKQVHKVDPEKCISCQLCVPVCPVGAITMVDEKAVIDPEKCINCGFCKNGDGQDFAGCPVGAISAP